MRIRCGIVAAVLGLLPLTARAQEEVRVTGRVVDSAGKPVAGADVAMYWDAVGNKMVPYQGAITNAEGRFTFAVTFPGRKQKLMVQDKERKTGALVWLEEKSAGKPVEIKLAPLIHVHGRISLPKAVQRPSYKSLSVSAETALVIRCSLRDAPFSFRLPPGDYRLRALAQGCEVAEKKLSLKTDTADVDLGAIDIFASTITKHKGKAPPPWHVTDARGVKKDVKLSDFKGKWVLLEFWGYW